MTMTTTDAQELVRLNTENAMPLKEQIVREIMSLVRPQPKRMVAKPTIEELEKILNSETTDDIQIEPDGSVSVRPKTTTVGAVAEAVVRLVEDALRESAATIARMQEDMGRMREALEFISRDNMPRWQMADYAKRALNSAALSPQSAEASGPVVDK
jgi:hypothetical protein